LQKNRGIGVPPMIEAPHGRDGRAVAT